MLINMDTICISAFSEIMQYEYGHIINIYCDIKILESL